MTDKLTLALAAATADSLWLGEAGDYPDHAELDAGDLARCPNRLVMLGELVETSSLGSLYRDGTSPDAYLLFSGGRLARLTAADLERAGELPDCCWCQRPAHHLVVVLGVQVPACADCAWAHENEPTGELEHEIEGDYADLCARNPNC